MGFTFDFYLCYFFSLVKLISHPALFYAAYFLKVSSQVMWSHVSMLIQPSEQIALSHNTHIGTSLHHVMLYVCLNPYPNVVAFHFNILWMHRLNLGPKGLLNSYCMLLYCYTYILKDYKFFTWKRTIIQRLPGSREKFKIIWMFHWGWGGLGKATLPSLALNH